MEPRFSDRVNATQPILIQLGSMDEALRNSIWNHVVPVIQSFSPTRGTKFIGENFFKVPGHQVPMSDTHAATNWLWELYSKLQWYEIYNLLEFVADNADQLSKGRRTKSEFLQLSNELLAREVSGYRFIQGSLSPISDKNEITAISEAMTAANAVGLVGVRTHIETALQLLGKKPDPDYRNSIKESISAVESVVKSVSGVGEGGLDSALKELVKKTEIHPALRDGFLKLYGYSSDQDGIRHAMLEEKKIGFDEAKFMLVACSAAANFLIAKANEAGLLKK